MAPIGTINLPKNSTRKASHLAVPTIRIMGIHCWFDYWVLSAQQNL